MLPVSQLTRTLIFKNAAVLSRAYGGSNIHHRTPTHNDLPVPCGDWQEKYKATNARYNVQLGASVVLLGSIIAYLKSSNVIDFNWSPPTTYE